MTALNPCPTCGSDNLPGDDRCQQCLHSLMQRDIPQTKKSDRFQSALMSSPVGDLLTGRDLLVCSPADTVQKIVKIFQKDKKGVVLVYDKKKLVGILSNRDLLLRVAGITKDLAKIKIKDVMTPNPSYVKPEDPIAVAVNIMALGGHRHVPVLRADGTPVSILLIRDVLVHLSSSQRGF
jgi:CBS domain-containing protein